MNRNITKQIEIGQKTITSAADLRPAEVEQLIDILTAKGFYEGLADAFYFGVAVGARISQEEKKG